MFIDLVPLLSSLTYLGNLRPPVQGDTAVGWILSHKSQIKKMSIDLPTGQHDRGNSSTEVPMKAKVLVQDNQDQVLSTKEI